MSVFFRFKISFQKEMIFTMSEFVDLKYPPSSALRMTLSLHIHETPYVLWRGPDYLFSVATWIFMLVTIVHAIDQASGTGTR